MDIKEMVIEVNGLPDNYPENIIIDKLTIHFLRRRNKGGDVLTVLYPTTNKGQAYVVFETEKVPGVLQHTHVLEVDSQFYPLDVKKMDQPLLDVPAETSLNINMFSSRKRIQEVLYSHGFQVSETKSGELRLQGPFLKLELIYPKLMQFLAEETHFQKRTPSHYTNGHSDSVFKADSNDCDYKSRSNVTSRHSHKNGNPECAARGSTSSGINSRSPESQNKWAFLQATSQVDGKTSTESSFSSPSRNYEDSRTSDQQWNPSPDWHSLHVEPYVYKYIRQFKEDSIEKIESDHHTHISYDTEVAQVKFSGGACKEASKELGDLMQNIASSLHTQEIDLDKLDNSRKRDIIQKANSFQKIYSVLIRQERNIIKVVGSSKDSYEAKKRLLGEKVDIAPAKPMERNLLRRSSSLPSQKSRARMENPNLKQSPEAAYSTAASSSSTSHCQMDPQLQQEVQRERVRQPSKSIAQRGRSQSANRLIQKNQKVNQEPSNYNQQDLTTSNKVQKRPKFLSALLPELKLKFKKGQK